MGKNTKTKPITVIFSFSNDPCNRQGLWNLKEEKYVIYYIINSYEILRHGEY